MNNIDKNTLLIATSGFAKSKYLEAIKEARYGHYDISNQSLEEANNNLNEAMKINDDITALNQKPTLLMVHAHNYLMNALLMKDFALEMIEFIKDVRDD